MKTMLRGLYLAVLATFVWLNGEMLMSSRLFLDEARLHKVQEGEYLSDIAQRYYGKSSYWRALALVNRAPDADLIFPGETIILPGAAAVSKIAAARRLTDVNEIANQEAALAQYEEEAERLEFALRAQADSLQAGGLPAPASSEGRTIEPEQDEILAPEPETEPPVDQAQEARSSWEPPEQPETLQEPEEQSSSMWAFWYVSGGVVVLAMAGYLLFRRRRNEDELIDASPVDDLPAFERDLRNASLTHDEDQRSEKDETRTTTPDRMLV